MSLHITGLRLRNWQRFKGEHALALRPTSYAIVAELDADPERSNMLGKTALAEAIRYALHGWLNPDRFDNTDGWIHRGERSGDVELTLSNGAVISRSKERGKSAVFKAGAAKGDEAQLLVASMLGLTQQDFEDVSYFPQGQIAQVVMADRGDLAEKFASWLRLGPLEMAAARVAKMGQEAEAEAAVLERTFGERLAIEHDALNNQLPEQLMLEHGEVEAAIATARSKISGLRTRIDVSDRVRALQNIRDEQEANEKQGRETKARLDGMDSGARRAGQAAARAATETAASTLAAKRSDVETKRRLAQGSFDGRCPVADIDCPAKSQINSRRAENTQLLTAAVEQATKASADYEEKRRLETSTTAAVQEVERLEERLEQLREQWRKMDERAAAAQDAAEPEDVEQLRAEVRVLEERLRADESAAAVLKVRIERAARAREEVAKLRPQLEERRAQLEVIRAAQAIFGRGGAQRVVAEEALREVEAGANELLRACGVPLEMSVRWSREGRGLAKVCDACGTPFPPSAKVKECQKCRAARGPLLVRELDVRLSDRSGAAEDLAGIAFQLAANKWLRSTRSAAWAVCVLDEPTAQLDAAFRRTLAQYLPRLLAGAGIVQSFLISHHSGMLDSLPGRILVTSSGGPSAARVVA